MSRCFRGKELGTDWYFHLTPLLFASTLVSNSLTVLSEYNVQAFRGWGEQLTTSTLPNNYWFPLLSGSFLSWFYLLIIKLKSVKYEEKILTDRLNMIKSLSNLSLITEASYWTVIMISRCVIWGCMSFWDAHGSFCQRRGSLHKPIHFFFSSLSCDEVRRSMSQDLSPIVYRWLIIKFRMLCFIVCQQGIGISTSDTETSDWFLAPSFR